MKSVNADAQKKPTVTASTSRQHLSLWLLALLLVIFPLTNLFAGGDNPGRKTAPVTEYRVFSGAWFEVRYPSGFTPRPSLKSSTAEGYDSAEFISADGAVSFYVFAPQWGGTAADIALDPVSERLLSEELRQLGDRQIRWHTVLARDGSYRRSYQETVARQGSVKTVVGIKYRNEAARLNYQKAYEQFRKSLKLYAD